MGFEMKMLTVSKLSQQQKAILECLYKSYKEPGFLPEGYWCHVGRLSWFVAHRFNRGHNHRVWDAKLAKVEVAKKLKGRDLAMAFYIIERGHRKPQLLTEKHRASFCRSLKRLEERGLIKRYVALKTEKRDGKWFWVWYVGDGRTQYVELTDKGIEVTRKMLTVSEA